MSELTHLAPEGWVRNATIRVRAVVERQGGVIARHQLRDCGVAPSRIGRWVARGWLLRLHPGIYALGHGAILPRGRLVAALLYAGPGSVLSHRTAAALWKLVERDAFEVHVSAPGRRRSIPGVIVHHPRSIERGVHDHLPVTTASRTLVDLAPSASDTELRKALANADFRGLIDADALAATMGRGRVGSARLRAAIARNMPELARTLSPLEDMLLLICERESVSLPEPNARVGPYMPDGLWPAQRVIVEVDGGAAHSSPSQRRRDAERDMELRAAGYLVLRYTWWQLERKPQAVAAEIRAALSERRSAN